MSPFGSFRANVQHYCSTCSARNQKQKQIEECLEEKLHDDDDSECRIPDSERVTRDRRDLRA